VKFKLKTAIKLALTCVLTTSTLIACLIIGCFWGDVGMLIGGAVWYLIFLLMFAFFIPWWFKDYIDYYWKNKEEKECLEKEVDL